jgi:hypothetical protein
MTEDLLAAIGAALGLDRPYRESPPPRDSGMIAMGSGQVVASGAGNRILGGTVDDATGRVGWVEETVGGWRQDGYLLVDITLNVAAPGTERLQVDLRTYNPFFGASVHLMRFYGDALVTIYTEKHRTYASRLVPPSPEQLFAVVDRPAVDIDDLWCYLRWHGNVEVLDLAEFRPCLPLPVPFGVTVSSLDVVPGTDGNILRWAEQVRADAPAGVPVHDRGWREARVCRLRLPDGSQRGFPTDRHAVWGRLRELLAQFSPPAGAADIVIGSVATPYWHPREPAGYGQLRLFGYEHPWWFPTAWYHFLNANEGTADAAARWLTWLEALAANPPAESTTQGWSPQWSLDEGAAQIALQHIRSRAAVIVSACRAGRLPTQLPHAWSAGDWGHELALTEFPPGLVEAWNRLPHAFRVGAPPSDSKRH